MTMFTCEFNPLSPCPANDGKGKCRASHVELVLAPHGWLRCITRMHIEDSSTPLFESRDVSA